MNKNRIQPFAMPFVIALASASLAGCGGSDNDGDDNNVGAPQSVSCADLNGMTIAAEEIGLPTTGALVTSTEVIPAAGEGAEAVGANCKVLGDITPVDPEAPPIKFQLNLPVDWNRKAMMFGGGGYNGIIATGTGNVAAGPVDQPVPLGRGYATFGSDSGHQAGPTTSRDGSFGLNEEALNNFSRDALKKTRDVAITLIEAHYTDIPEQTYFAGGSTGGREALLAVSNWPQDFDGAIVLYPAWDAVALDLMFGRFTRELAKPGAYPNRLERQALFDAAMEACDGLDGVEDGVISNQTTCNEIFYPATAMLNGVPLRCPGGEDTGDDCLSDAQIGSFKVLNSPLTLTYPLASGETGYPGFNAWGSDFGIPSDSPLQPTVVTLALGTVQPAHPMPPVSGALDSPPYGSTFWDEWVRYFVARDPDFNSLSLDPAVPGDWQARIIELSAIQEVTETDLSEFRARGGKILIAHGTSDVLVSNRSTQRYFNRLRATMGTDAVGSFVRYYEIPGYAHALSTVFNAAWDSVTALENWVEEGVAPTDQVVTDSVGVPGRTRPLCEYPAWPKYNGSGDADSAQNFTCVAQ